MHKHWLRNPLLVVSAAALFTLGACGDDDSMVVPGDAGADAGPRTDGGGDEEAPRVVETTPVDGAVDVALDSTVVIRFSEPMTESAGTFQIDIDGEPVTADRSWAAGSTELVLAPELPSGARVRVTLESDFADLAGTRLAAPFVLSFDTADEEAPVVVTSTPSEGATGVSARLAQLRVSFSEPMDATTGSLALEGGPGTLGELAWVFGGFVVPVEGLAYDTEYRVVLSGFADPAGNPLDGSVTLSDGAIDFTTGPDLDPPRVVDASPSEGQVDVPDTTSAVVVVFDEAMDTAVTEASLVADGTPTTVVGTWNVDATEIELDVTGELAPNAAHRLVLEGFRDAAGNALDPVAHLGDGALDFVTGLDIFAPYVGFTDPVEGQTDVSFRLDTLVVVFSESMDTSVTSVSISDGTSSFTAEGTWSLAGTRLELDVSGELFAGRSYSIDFTDFTDAGGTPLDVLHPYLGDGVLGFTLAAPTGESCRDALTVAEATSTTGGLNEWVIAPGAVTENDGSNTCPGGNSPGVDAVIRYTKTTPAASAGGTVLRIHVASAETASTAWMSVAVFRDQCNPAAVGTGPARIRCVDDHNPQQLFLDVGPGDYYIWVSRYTGSDFRGATVQVDEVATAPEGESCVAPYSTTTSSALYTAPASSGDPHVWNLPPGAVVAVDHAVAYNGPGAMVCDTSFSGTADTTVGADAVLALPKSSATSVGWLQFEPIDTSTEIVAELVDRCDTTDPATVSLACEEGRRILSGTPRLLETAFAGPAGNRYLWLAADSNYNDFPGGIVRYKEIEPAAGDTCATAITVPVGATTTVTPDRPHRLPAPSCFGSSESVTWYRFTTTERFTHVRADAAANIAVVRAGDASEVSCEASAATDPLVVFAPVGTDVCVAVTSGSAVGSLGVEAFPYSGNLGIDTDLGVTRPLTSTGSTRSFAGDTWMSVTPTTLYMGVGVATTAGVAVVPKAGGVTAEFRDDVTSTLGNDGVAVGEAIFSVDDTALTTATFRLERLVTSGGMWSPTPWDTGSAYPAIGIDAMTYDGTSLVAVTDWLSTQPTRFYSLSATAPGAATLLGMTNLVRDVVGIAADSTYFYLVGHTGTAATTEGVYRLPRADLTATPTLLALVAVDGIRASIEIDSDTAPAHLYFRADDGSIHVITDPAGATPRHLGAISRRGRAGDDAMTLDRATGAIYLLETVTDTGGNLVRLN